MERHLSLALGRVERAFRKLSTFKLQWSDRALFDRCKSIGTEESTNRVEACVELDPDGACQRYSVCLKHSPGPVLDSEGLARWVFTPPHVKKPLPGEFCDSFFEEIFSTGLSIQRLHCKWSRASKEVHELGQAQVKDDGKPDANGFVRPKRTYLGAIQFSTSELRNLKAVVDDATTELHVYDTGLPANRKHAEVMARAHGGTNKKLKASRQQMRVRLMVLANQSGIYKSPFLEENDPNLLALQNIQVR